MDGVLWRTDEPIGDLPALFACFDELGLKCIFATNNSSLTVEQYVDKLTAFGIPAQPWQIVTSGTATADYLHEKHPDGGKLYILGADGLHQTLEAHGFTHSDESPLAVVVGFDRGINYDKLTTATLLIRGGVPFIGTNPDHTFPSPQGLVPGAGAVLAAIQAATNVEPLIFGKPQPAMFERAIERLGIAPQETLVVGDRLETDIAGGQAAACPTAVVLTGVATRSQASQWSPAPDLILPDLTTLADKLQHGS